MPGISVSVSALNWQLTTAHGLQPEKLRRSKHETLSGNSQPHTDCNLIDDVLPDFPFLATHNRTRIATGIMVFYLQGTQLATHNRTRIATPARIKDLNGAILATHNRTRIATNFGDD